MIKLSDSQRAILKAASRQPKSDIRSFMTHIKSPPIRDRVIASMLGNGLVVEEPGAEGVIYVISDAGYAAIGKARAEAEAPAEKREPKSKREGGSKKQTMIDMLSRDEGATIKQLMDATLWQKHSVHGAMANLKKELQEKHGQTITGSTGEGEERIYRIAQTTGEKSPAK